MFKINFSKVLTGFKSSHWFCKSSHGFCKSSHRFFKSSHGFATGAIMSPKLLLTVFTAFVIVKSCVSEKPVCTREQERLGLERFYDMQVLKIADSMDRGMDEEEVRFITYRRNQGPWVDTRIRVTTVCKRYLEELETNATVIAAAAVAFPPPPPPSYGEDAPCYYRGGAALNA